VRFQLANSAPICQGLLGEQLGYLADTETAQAILDGRFELTPDIDDATSTCIMLEEIARIGAQLTNGDIIIEITPDDFRE
jgi:proteasome assembly chaperone (PAC2) family protein